MSDLYPIIAPAPGATTSLAPSAAATPTNVGGLVAANDGSAGNSCIVTGTLTDISGNPVAIGTLLYAGEYVSRPSYSSDGLAVYSPDRAGTFLYYDGIAWLLLKKNGIGSGTIVAKWRSPGAEMSPAAAAAWTGSLGSGGVPSCSIVSSGPVATGSLAPAAVVPSPSAPGSLAPTATPPSPTDPGSLIGPGAVPSPGVVAPLVAQVPAPPVPPDGVRYVPQSPSAAEKAIALANIGAAAATDVAALKSSQMVNALDFLDAAALAARDDTVALQAALDAGGASGMPTFIPPHPLGFWRITAALRLRYAGQKVIGTCPTYETSSKSRIVQATAGEGGFRLEIPGGGFVSTHFVILEDLCIVGLGSGTSTAPGLDFWFDPQGGNFADFVTCRRVWVNGFDMGLRAGKFSNAGFYSCMFYQCRDGVNIGGNCNNISFYSCHLGFPGEACIHIVGSGAVNFFGCEMGNGPRLIQMDLGGIAIGMSLYMARTTVESMSLPSVITNGNTLIVDGMRFMAGSYPSIVPFETSGVPSIELRNVSMVGYTAATYLCRATQSAAPKVSSGAINAAAPPPSVAIFDSEAWATLIYTYGHSNGFIHDITGYIAPSAALKGFMRIVARRPNLGGPDDIQICMETAAETYQWLSMLPSLDRSVIYSAGTNAVAQRMYMTAPNGTSRAAFTLPAAPVIGDEVSIVGEYNTYGWTLQRSGSQMIRHLSSNVASINSVGQWDTIRVRYVDVNQWQVVAATGI